MGKAKKRTTPDPSNIIPRFERMLAELSARFINLPAARVDDAINDALRGIATIVGVDRIQLVRLSADADNAQITHSGAVEGIPSVPPKPIADLFPWALGRLRAGEVVVVRNMDALPPEAAVDLSSWRRASVLSCLAVPLRVAKRTEGALAFGSLSREHDWPDELVARVGVLADVFANALAHKRAQEGLDAAIGFERLVSETLAALLTAPRTTRDRVIETGLGNLARAFGAERATLWQHVAGRDDFIKTHRWLADGVPQPSDSADATRMPWMHARLRAREVVEFARHAELPPEAQSDLPALRALGIRACIAVPLVAADTVVGALSFSTSTVERSWPGELIPRIGLLGEVFASTLAREASERREQEAQLQAAHAARVGSMGMLAASLVHELTQPLAASLANAENAAELLESASPDLEELRSAVADIVADDRRVGELIQQLRRFLRRGESERKDVDVRDVIDEVLRLVESDAADNSVDIALDFPAALPNVLGDRVQLQQVILNLLLNAIDAVLANDPAERKVNLACTEADNGVRVEVSDCGAGMDQETISRVFQPFFTTKPGGMGLGLSISRTIVAAHGGTLSIKSTKGRGTTFRLDLPSRSGSAVAQSNQRTVRAAFAGTVYVVDDDASMRRAIERQLRSAGHTVELFASARAFLEHRPDNGISCLVSDVRMPGLSGLDLQASLAAAKRDLPVVFISGHGDVPTTVQALKAGAVSFLAKPFTKSQLLDAVSESLARSRERADKREISGVLESRYETLTPREREVFALVASGMLNKVIAHRLGAAEGTIKIHRGRVMEKMGAASVAELVRMAASLPPANQRAS